ncbi:MAG TPA: class I SAM-dependent methyltransferase [Bryobacteraceae bacterium]|nr:class I SAM-dependent methyltransferase [Bryobacteraceae bacterium]
MGIHAKEVEAGERFEFGRNWARFLSTLTESQIENATESLRVMLGCDRSPTKLAAYKPLEGRSFIDVGSGSGLFSLAARRLGAGVHSFDYDPHSVGCTKELRRRYFPDDPQWVVEEGSALDPAYLASLGRFDVVYSWGVLHHTGSMWEALGNVAPLVAPGGQLVIAIYNDQGTPSHRWKTVKRLYNRTPPALRFLISFPVFVKQYWRPIVKDFLLLRPFHCIRNYDKRRGMTAWSDLVDWVGGYPFEVAKPAELFDFYRVRGFQLERLVTCGGTLGCNELVFRKS